MLVFGGVGGFNDFLIFTPFFWGGRNDPIRYQLISYDEIMDLLLNIYHDISQNSLRIFLVLLWQNQLAFFFNQKHHSKLFEPIFVGDFFPTQTP